MNASSSFICPILGETIRRTPQLEGVVGALFLGKKVCRGLLPLPHVQFWETENSWRLDSAHRGSRRRNPSYLVDDSAVRTVNALNTPPAWSG